MGGSERIVYDIVRMLDDRAFTCTVIGFEDGPFRALYERLGIKTQCISKSKKIDAGFVRDFRSIIADEKVEVMNPHHFSPLFYTFLATRFTGVRVIYTEHSRWQLEELAFHKKIANRIMLGGIDGVVAISGQIEDYYLNRLRIPRKKIHLIYNGIDTAAFGSGSENGLRRQLGINKNDLVIGTVANIRPEKNLKLLVSAFSDLAKVYGNAVLVIIGQDFMEGELQSFAGRSGAGDRILFLGRRDDVPSLMKVLDIFCLPSIYEGLPLTVLEAMAAGVPVIGSDVLGISEVIRHMENGLLFPSNDREKLAECIAALIKDDALRKRISLSGRRSVERRYSFENMIAGYERLFSSL